MAVLVYQGDLRDWYAGPIRGGLRETADTREDDACLQLPSAHVMSLHMCAHVCFLSCLLNLPYLLIKLDLLMMPCRIDFAGFRLPTMGVS
jgi:hypothetical protein